MDQIVESSANDFAVEEVKGIDDEFIAFVKRQYGEVFVRAEELDQEDIQLSAIGESFQESGLERSRKILKIQDTKTKKVLAAVVANRAPLGLNFSFLENRAYYILDKDLGNEKRARILKTMSAAIKPYYNDFAIRAIPIVTDAFTSKTLQLQKATFSREYMQSIWMREGFSMWYDHISSFLRRIEKRA